MRKLTCHCEQKFSVDIPESVNLDATPELITDIADGSFLSCFCPTCNTKINTDLRTELFWPSKKAHILLLPETDRYSFFSGKITVPEGAQTVLGYPELADRVAILNDNLNTLTIETIKYHLAVKAKQTDPEAVITVFYDHTTENGDLEFHIHGLRKEEVALTNIPAKFYETIKQNIEDSPNDELFLALTNNTYISWQNILIEEDTDA